MRPTCDHAADTLDRVYQRIVVVIAGVRTAIFVIGSFLEADPLPVVMENVAIGAVQMRTDGLNIDLIVGTHYPPIGGAYMPKPKFH